MLPGREEEKRRLTVGDEGVHFLQGSGIEREVVEIGNVYSSGEGNTLTLKNDVMNVEESASRQIRIVIVHLHRYELRQVYSSL